MGTYMMMTRLSPEALQNPSSVDALNGAVVERIKKECPNVKWLANYGIKVSLLAYWLWWIQLLQTLALLHSGKKSSFGRWEHP